MTEDPQIPAHGLKSGQYDDLDGASWRAIDDD
ncbi:MAG: cbb3-type cytochrome oxidase assembly protein CcoS [Pseudomonadota bacterium]